MVLHPPISKPVAALSIAGSDSGGGAGLQADLRTFAAHGILGCTAVTAITAQNTLGVRSWKATDGELVGDQIRAVMDDLPIGAAKVGMVGSAEVARAIAEVWLEIDDAPPLVVDTPLVSSAGQTLVDERALDTVRRLLLPIATVITPNVAEAAALLGIERVENPTDILAALAALCGGGTTVVLTGGDTARGSQAIDRVRLADGRHLSLETPWVTTRCDHGTGCTFSAAIAAAMALDQPVEAALHSAKTYLSRALRTARPVGAGRGPVDHLWALRSDMRDSDD